MFILMLVLTVYDAPVASNIEFRTMAHCQAAATAVRKESRVEVQMAICAAKGNN